MTSISRRAALALAWLPTLGAMFALTPIIGSAALPWILIAVVAVVGLGSRVHGSIARGDLARFAAIAGLTFIAAAVGWYAALATDEMWLVVGTFAVAIAGGLTASAWVLVTRRRGQRTPT